MNYDEFSNLALALPEVTETVKRTEIDLHRGEGHMARVREKGKVIAIRLPWDVIDRCLESDAFFVTDHYRGWPYVLVRLSDLDAVTAEKLIMESWEVAPITLPRRSF
ncbi:MAG: MmcQ/YjbR family DNA-binding protein [Armatimonadetes bacterium]|nr:MmcQ/YjbR family DNA-binding protein [Armatimonadota bacterium]